MPCHRYVSFSVQLALLLLFCGLPARAVARVMILDNPVRMPFSGFASSMAIVGDLDGDGVSDYIIKTAAVPIDWRCSASCAAQSTRTRCCCTTSPSWTCATAR